MVGILLHGDNHFNVRRPLTDLGIAPALISAANGA